MPKGCWTARVDVHDAEGRSRAGELVWQRDHVVDRAHLRVVLAPDPIVRKVPGVQGRASPRKRHHSRRKPSSGRPAGRWRAICGKGTNGSSCSVINRSPTRFENTEAQKGECKVKRPEFTCAETSLAGVRCVLHKVPNSRERSVRT